MAEHEPSSLDRFLWGRGQDFFDLRRSSCDGRPWLWAGAAESVLGVGVLGSVAFLPPDAALFTSVFGAVLLTWGAASLWSGLSRRRQWQYVPAVEVGVSAEGQRLLHKICGHIGYYNWQDEPRGRSLVGIRGYRTAGQILPGGLFQLLEPAAFSFNRIEGLLQERSSWSDSSLKALQPSIRAAAIEAMVIVVNHAAWVDTFPENASDHRNTIEAKTAQLQELGDRVAGLVSAKPNLTDSFSSRSLMDEVLETLKNEEQARQELPSEPWQSPSR